MNRKLAAALTALCSPGDRIVCALSGGADSVALLHSLLDVKEELSLTVTAAHFNHCLRGAESDGDEAFVRELCTKWGVELTVGRGDPRNLQGKSLEEAARELRYTFLLSQPGLIATAHHGDDQVETVLLNILRGTGLRGLCGMQPRQDRVIRPLLTIPREEILTYVVKNDLPFRTDSTNETDFALRNRLRHHVLPLLQQENPNLTDTVCRMTALLRQEDGYLQQQTEALLQTAAREDGYDCPTLQNAHPVLRRRAIRQLLPNPKPSMLQVEAVEQLLSRQDGSSRQELPGGFLVRRSYDRLIFEPTPAYTTFSPGMLRPGETISLSELNMTITLTGPETLTQPVDFVTTFAIRFSAAPAIAVRPRQTGDTIALPGGRKTLKKWMIDRKIPVHQRDLLPVFADDQGVFAVFGMGADCERAAQPGEQAWILHIVTKGERL